MLIKLTFANKAHDEFYMLAKDVRTVQRDPANPMQTILLTAILTPGGPTAYNVIESPDTIARLVNDALRGGVLN